jgi:hypothetical protein
MLGRDDAKNARKPKAERTPVPELAPEEWAPEKVKDDAWHWVGGLEAWELDDYEQSRLESRRGKFKWNGRNARALFVVKAVKDAEVEGKRVYSDDDAEWLGKKSAKAIDRLYEVAARLSGRRKEDEEELEDNLKKITSAGFSASSQCNGDAIEEKHPGV